MRLPWRGAWSNHIIVDAPVSPALQRGRGVCQPRPASLQSQRDRGIREGVAALIESAAYSPGMCEIVPSHGLLALA